MNDIEVMQAMNDIDLSKVETAFPLLATGVVSARINKCAWDKDASKGADAKPYVLVEYALTNAWKTIEREGLPSHPVNPGDRGSTFTERIYVGTYEDKKTGETRWYGVERCAQLREAVFGKAPAGTKFNPAELIGQDVTVRLLYEAAPKDKKTGEVFGPRTSVNGYVRKTRAS